MKFFFFLSFSFLLLSSNLKAQESVLSFKNENVSTRIKKDSYSLSNIKNGDLAIVLVERKSVYAYLYNSDFKLQSKLSTGNLKTKYNEVIGYSIVGQTYNVLYTNETKQKFAILKIDFELKSMDVEEVTIEMQDEMYLDAVSYKNNLYYLTATDDLSLRIRAFDNNLNFNIVKTFSLSEIENASLLYHSNFRIGSFMLAGSKVSGVTKIDQRSPTSIEQTSAQAKIYQRKKNIYLTFENGENKTSVYDIDLENLSVNFSTFDYPKGKLGAFKKFNSYIYDDTFYQIASSKEEMLFSIKTLKNEPIKEFYIHKDASIAFKNSPIIQEGMTVIPFVNKREMEETSKYLRKITSGDLGITVLKNKNAYYITLGGFEMINYSGPSLTSMHSLDGTFAAFNATYIAYNSYSYTKSTYFNSIFDLEYNHLKGTFEENVFDKIKAFQTSKKYITAEDVFFHNDSIYFGYFNQKEGMYNLLKF